MKAVNENLIASLIIAIPTSIAFGYWQDSWSAGLFCVGVLLFFDNA